MGGSCKRVWRLAEHDAALILQRLVAAVAVHENIDPHRDVHGFADPAEELIRLDSSERGDFNLLAVNFDENGDGVSQHKVVGLWVDSLRTTA